jgi:hypothetical protein
MIFYDILSLVNWINSGDWSVIYKCAVRLCFSVIMLFLDKRVSLVINDECHIDSSGLSTLQRMNSYTLKKLGRFFLVILFSVFFLKLWIGVTRYFYFQVRLGNFNLLPRNFESPKQIQQIQPTEINDPSVIKWAIATLVTLSSGKIKSRNSITYTDQAVLLAKQLSSRYPNVPLLAVVAIGQVNELDSSLLSSVGYQLLWRKSVLPPFAIHQDRIPSVYYDQYMKFWLWNETGFDRIVYLDSDTYFTDTRFIDFHSFFNSVYEDRVVACPTPWSKTSAIDKAPITWNGGFFIMKPSESRFTHLMESSETPMHFAVYYNTNFGWFDMSEMGAFMRDFPNFTTPTPMWQYCADTLVCCVSGKCVVEFDMPKKIGWMVHGMKPDGLVVTGQPLTDIFNHQRLDVFQGWGYDPECMLSQFYAPLTQLYVDAGLLE